MLEVFDCQKFIFPTINVCIYNIEHICNCKNVVVLIPVLLPARITVPDQGLHWIQRMSIGRIRRIGIRSQ